MSRERRRELAAAVAEILTELGPEDLSRLLSDQPEAPEPREQELLERFYDALEARVLSKGDISDEELEAAMDAAFEQLLWE